MSDNKRRFTRIKINRPFFLTLPDGTIYRGNELEDLSIGGCQVGNVAQLEVGIECTIEILLGEEKTDQTIVVSGTIARSGKESAAVKFESIDPDSLFLLQNLIRYNTEDPETIEEEIADRPGIV